MVGGPPAFQYEDGLFLISAWAPILQPEDAPNPEVAAVIRKGSEFGLRDLSSRNAQHYAADGLVGRIHMVTPNDLNNFCKKLALRAALHHPVDLAEQHELGSRRGSASGGRRARKARDAFSPRE
jgi:hypothetical protein